MAFQYKHVLLVGATAGIGKAMADRLIKEGVTVTAVGRRKDRLDEFVTAHGSSKAKAAQFDITKLDDIPGFAASVMETSPDIDCLFLNAGVQSHSNFSKPETVDLARFLNEFNVNFTSFVAFTHAFLPYLLRREKDTGIIYTGAHLGVVPAAPMPAYCSSKAALDSFIMCIREQLRESDIKVVNLSPPLVQSELHDGQYGEEKGRQMGMPVDAFVDQAYKSLASGEENCIIGSLGASSYEQYMEIVDRRQAAFDRLVQLMKSM